MGAKRRSVPLPARLVAEDHIGRFAKPKRDWAPLVQAACDDLDWLNTHALLPFGLVYEDAGEHDFGVVLLEEELDDLLDLI